MEWMKEKLANAIRNVLPDTPENAADRLISSENVVILPCNIGDRIYIVGTKYKHGSESRYVNSGHFCWGDMDKFGKTVFLTKKEAIEARNRLEGNLCSR